MSLHAELTNFKMVRFIGPPCMYVSVFATFGAVNDIEVSPKRLTPGHAVAASTSHKRLESESASG